MRLGLGLVCLLAGMALLGRTIGWRRRSLPGIGPRTPAAAALLGGVVAAGVLQSSSLSVAGIVAAADGGGLGLAQAWAAVAGANLGSTLLPQLTAWRLPGPVLAVGAALGAAACLHVRLRPGGLVLLGAALLAGGFGLVSGAAGGGLPVAGILRAAGAAPVAAFLAGVGLTAALFSSGFTIAVAQGLAAAGALPLEAGIAFVCGANVGTTADVLFASLGVGERGRATAVFHLGFNVLAAGMGLALLHPLSRLPAGAGVPPARAMAHAHTAINLAAALALLPLIPRLAAAAERRLAQRRTPGIRRR